MGSLLQSHTPREPGLLWVPQALSTQFPGHPGAPGAVAHMGSGAYLS